MERMSEEEFINNIEGHITSLKNLDNKALKILVGKLEEENKNLKLIQETNEKQIQNDIKERDELREEIKTLKEEIENHKQNIMQDELEIIPKLEEENKNLKEKVETLEQWLDNKEKLNEKYRKEIDNKKLSTIAEETIQDLQDRIKELI